MSASALLVAVDGVTPGRSDEASHALLRRADAGLTRGGEDLLR